jgi:histidine ammonia-lyase
MSAGWEIADWSPSRCRRIMVSGMIVHQNTATSIAPILFEFCRLGQKGAFMGSQHRFPAFAVLVAILIHAFPATARDGAVSLDGKSLTIPQVIQVAAQYTPVAIAPSAMEHVSRSFQLLLAAAEQGIPIYGVNRGVGQNKDKPIFSGPLDAEQSKASLRFNANNLRATSAGAGPDAPEIAVRAAMLIRLNTMLVGQTGAQPRVAELYRDFLNYGIHPVLPTRASVGEADITILAHIGLAMMGEGEVIYAGRRMRAAQALAEAQVKPLQPFGKDSLAIMSSNAYAAAVAVLALHDAEALLSLSIKVFALSLEALNGNVSPFLESVHSIRPYATQGKVAAAIRHELEDSFLWSRDDKRALQDPLSYRTASHVLAVAVDALTTLREGLLVQINSSDDNPAVIPGIRAEAGAPAQVRAYYVERGELYGAVIPTANFEPLPWVVPLEASCIALSHVSRAAAARITRLGAPEFTKLSRCARRRHACIFGDPEGVRGIGCRNPGAERSGFDEPSAARRRHRGHGNQLGGRGKPLATHRRRPLRDRRHRADACGAGDRSAPPEESFADARIRLRRVVPQLSG